MNNPTVSYALWALVAIPFMYLAYLYPGLPAEVPVRFGPDGTPVAFGPKSILWLLPTAGPLLTAIIFSFVVPSAVYERSPRKLSYLVLLTTAFMSGIMVYLLYGTARGSLVHVQFMYFIIGGMLAVIGNFLPVVPPNRWIGIRLPVTLRDEEVWWRTHRRAGPVWVAGGVFVMVASLFFGGVTLTYILLATVALLAVTSTVFAYRT